MSDSPKNNNGLDPEEIKDIERIIEQRSESAKAAGAPKRYLRRATSEAEKPTDSAVVIN